MGEPIVVACDGRCDKAWGINNRPRYTDGGVERFRSDDSLPTAPIDPGTYEGGDAKPTSPCAGFEHTKWCVRECERCVWGAVGEPLDLPEF